MRDEIESFAEEHAQDLDAATENTLASFSRQIASAKLAIAALLTRSLTVDSGVVQMSTTFSATLSKIPELFTSQIRVHGYYVATRDFVKLFDAQVDQALAAIDLMNLDLGTPYLSQIQRDFVVGQKLAAKRALDMEPMLVSVRLAQAAYSFSPGQTLSGMIDYFGSIADQLMDVSVKLQLFITSFFRKVLGMFYFNFEKSKELWYKYVGPADKKNRPFCAGIIVTGRVYRFSEIEEMDNGQIPGVLENGGGYGCRHWWAATKLRKNTI